MTAQALNDARFTKEAAEWDSNKKHVESTAKAVQAIQEFVPAFKDGKGKDIDVLEIGCGTGLVSFMLSPLIHSLIGVDTAEGMTSAFKTKLSAMPPSKANLTCINHLLTNPDSPELQSVATQLQSQLGNAKSSSPHRFDLVVSHLTLHHIPSLPEVFATMYGCLKPGGMVALTDYEDFGNEAIRFHPVSKRPGVERHGLKRDEVARQLIEAGFVNVRVEEAFVLNKEVQDEDGMEVLNGREMGFPFLMCFGIRR